jgi:hypothetical protein
MKSSGSRFAKIADAGYRGHNAPPEHQFRVYTAGQKRRVTAQIKREFKRRVPGIAGQKRRVTAQIKREFKRRVPGIDRANALDHS